MERPRVNFEVWPEAIELGHLFAARGYELALVGGAVRDLLLHRRSHDLDFCTSAHPDEFEPILRHWGRDGFWDMGRKFGTLGAMRRREDGTEVKVEITTYRSDTYDPESRCACRSWSSWTRSAAPAIWLKAYCARRWIRISPSTTTRCA